MEKQEYQLSPNIRIIPDSRSGLAMVYNTLYGNPMIVNDEGLRFLNLFKQSTTIEGVCKICDENPEEIIQEFAKVFFLIKVDFNEREFLHQQKSQHLSKVGTGRTVDRMGLAISNSCNFGCADCIHFQSSSNNGVILPIYQKPIKQLNMNWETAKKCVDLYIALRKEHGDDHCKIHFGNAEPLINWPVVKKILDYCGDMSKLTFEFAINTNLVLMTKEIAEVLKKYRVRISTSLDGTLKSNDAVRIFKGGQGTFDCIVKKFDLLAEIGYPLDGFSITVTNKNFDLIDIDIIDLAAERNMVSIAFDYDLISLVNVPVATRVGKLMFLKRYANEKGIDFFGTWDSAFRNLTSESLLKGSYAFCAAVEGKSIEFDVDGSIKVCSHTTTKVGDINTFGQMFDRTGGLFKIVKERFPGTDDYCSGCAIEGSCGGQCHVTREVVTRSVGEKRQALFADMCDFYRTVTETLALEYVRSNGTAAIGNRQTCTL